MGWTWAIWALAFLGLGLGFGLGPHLYFMSDSGSGPHKGALKRTYQAIGQSSDIGTKDPDVGDRHQNLPTEGEIEHQWSERYSGPRKVDPRIIVSYQLKRQIR